MTKLHIIDGATGQDGVLLTRYLQETTDDSIVGLTRDVTGDNARRFKSCFDDIDLIDNREFIADDQICLGFSEIFVYQFSGQSSVGLSFKDPQRTLSSHISWLADLFEALAPYKEVVKVFYPLSGDCFGGTVLSGATEITPFNPKSPYAEVKVMAYEYCEYLRRNSNFYISYGILFNHESVFRKERFALRKIVNQAREVVNGRRLTIEVGNVDIVRDWGAADDFVRAMPLITAAPSGELYIVSTGTSLSLRSLVDYVLGRLGLTWREHVVINPKLFRDSEVVVSIGDPTKIEKNLGWKASKSIFDVIDEMLDEC